MLSLIHIFDDIEGQTEINNSISSSKISVADGETVNNVATDVRPLVFTLTINENIDVEEAKRYIDVYKRQAYGGTNIDSRSLDSDRRALDRARIAFDNAKKTKPDYKSKTLITMYKK